MPTDPDHVLDSFSGPTQEQTRRSTLPRLANFPDIVYVPAHPGPGPDHGVVRFETRCLPSGEAVGVAFRSQSALVEALGPAQPWMALPLSRLEVIFGAAGITRTLIDPPVDESAAWWTAERISALTERLDGDHG
jgi:hypothetical protein